MVHYNRLISYLLLSASAFWALSQCDGNFVTEFWCCSNIGFGLICINGFLGLWNCSRATTYANAVKNVKSKPNVFSTISFFTYLYSIPLIIFDIYLYYLFSYKVAIIHLLYPLLALVPRIIRKRENIQVVDLIMLIHIGSMTTTCAIKQNYYGLGAGVILALSHFFISSERKTLGITARTLQNYLMCVFVVLSFKALVVAEKNWLFSTTKGKDTLSAC